MVVAAAQRYQAEPVGEREQGLDLVGAVVLVVDLHAGQPCLRQPLQEWLEPAGGVKLARVGESGEAADVVDQVDDLFRRQVLALDVGGAGAAEVQVERLVDVGHVAGLDERQRDVGAADGAFAGERLHALPLNRLAKLCQPLDHLLGAPKP